MTLFLLSVLLRSILLDCPPILTVRFFNPPDSVQLYLLDFVGGLSPKK